MKSMKDIIKETSQEPRGRLLKPFRPLDRLIARASRFPRKQLLSFREFCEAMDTGKNPSLTAENEPSKKDA